MKIALASLLVVTLAACGGGSPGAEDQSDQAVPADETNVASTETANVAVAPAPADNAAAPAEAAATAIPAVLQGRWALVPGDCTTQWGDAKGLLTVTGDELRFYESSGKVNKVIDTAPEKVTADFDFQGEGEEWQRRMTLERDGDKLVRRETGEGAAAEPFRYARCAG